MKCRSIVRSSKTKNLSADIKTAEKLKAKSIGYF